MIQHYYGLQKNVVSSLDTKPGTSGYVGCRDRMVVGFTTTYAISAYHDLSCEFEPHSWRGVPDTTLCDKV